MSATPTSQSGEKRATSSAPNRPVHPQPSPAGEAQRVRTRSAADPTQQTKQSNKYNEARKFLSANHLMAENTLCTTQTLAGVLLLMAENYRMSENVAKALKYTAEVMQHIDGQCQGCANASEVPPLIKKLQEDLSADLNQKLNALEQKLASPPAHDQIEAAVKEIGNAAQSIKTSISDIGSTIAQVTDTSSQLANTATSYRDALLKSGEQQQQLQQHSNRPNPGQPMQLDPKILRDIDRKQRQILIDTHDATLLETSLAGIKERLSTAITGITDPPPPKDASILDVNKLRKGGITVVFKERSTAEWVQRPEVATNFTKALADDASIAKRLFSILVPRIPITFNPADQTHLREVEECNEIPQGTIAKARWIKPINRRDPKQQAAHAIFSLTEVNIANICIRDGIYVCGLRTHPCRLKHEPMQCMKCRRWGHFANACTANSDTCGTCGGDHRTNVCNSKEKTYCVSCKSDDHPSWDRDCPEFRRRCAQFDENYPENNLPYFPSSEEWTLTPRPNRLQFSEKFPARYSVSAYPQPSQTHRSQANRSTGKQRKQQKTMANQSTMDQFIGQNGAPRRAENMASNPGLDFTDEAPGNPFPEFDRTNFGASPQPEGWD